MSDNPIPLSSTAQAPTRVEIIADRVFRGLSFAAAGAIVLLLVYILYVIGREAGPAMLREGPGFLTRSIWSPGTGQLGILPEIFGTLYSSLRAPR